MKNSSSQAQDTHEQSILYLADDVLILDFPYESDRVAQVKALPGARWDKVGRVWRLPVSSLRQTRDLAIKWDFNISNEVLAFDLPKHANPGDGVSIEGKYLMLSFRFDPVMVKSVKQIPSVTWDSRTKAWKAPLTSIESVIKWATTFKQPIPSYVKDEADRISASLTETREASRSVDADISISRLHGELLPYQRAGVAYASQTRRSFIADEMGLGKTIQAMSTLEYIHAEYGDDDTSPVYPAVVICPPSLVLNWKKEYNKFFPDLIVETIANRKEIPMFGTYDVLIVGYSNITAWEKQLCNHNAYIFDESHYCFTGGTIVSTPNGDMTIREIFESREDVYVATCASWGSAVVYNRVINKFKLISHELVKVIHEHGEFICTPDHQILTKFGYIEASSLTQDCYLRVLPERISSKTFDQQVLLKVVQGNSDSVLENGGRGSDRLNATRCQETNGRGQPDVLGGNKSKGIKHVEGNGSSAKNKRWKWARIDETSENIMGGARRNLGDRIRSVLWKTQTDGTPNTLQNRYSEPTDKNSNRGRWGISQGIINTRKGHEEKTVPCFSRVVGVEVYESGDRQQLGNGTSIYSVYDIEVEKTHTFFADGVLVSNCKSRDAQRTKSAKKITKSNKDAVVLCLTGTPVTNRPAEYAPQLDIMGQLDKFGGLWGFYRRYCNAFQDKWGQWHLEGNSNLDELNDKLRATCYIRRTKDQVLTELPPVMHDRVVIDGAPAIMKEYKKAESDIVAYLVERAKQIAQELGLPVGAAAVMARLKAEANEHLVRMSVLRKIAARAKMPIVEEWVDAHIADGKKVVIAAHHRDIVDMLANRYGGLKIQGGMDVEAVEEAKHKFQTLPVEKAPVIVLSIQAAKTGHTLTAAQDVLFVELPWTPADVDQTYSRCHRIGQKGSVTSTYMLASGTIDEDIYSLIEKKRAVVGRATEGAMAFDDNDSVANLVLKLMNLD